MCDGSSFVIQRGCAGLVTARKTINRNILMLLVATYQLMACHNVKRDAHEAVSSGHLSHSRVTAIVTFTPQTGWQLGSGISIGVQRADVNRLIDAKYWNCEEGIHSFISCSHDSLVLSVEFVGEVVSVIVVSSEDFGARVDVCRNVLGAIKHFSEISGISGVSDVDWLAYPECGPDIDGLERLHMLWKASSNGNELLLTMQNSPEDTGLFMWGVKIRRSIEPTR